MSVTAVKSSFVAFQDGDNPWRGVTESESSDGFFTHSFDVSNQVGDYRLILVCPSEHRTLAHQVFFYESNVKEISKVYRDCNKIQARPSTERQTVYGEVTGVDVDKGEIASINVQDSQSTATEAYALRIPKLESDVLGLMGELSESDNSIAVKKFYIARNYVRTTEAKRAEKKVEFADKTDNDSINLSISYVPRNSQLTIPVTVPQLGNAESFRAKSTFISENGSRLTLNESNGNQIIFTPLPVYRYQSPDRIAGISRNFLHSNEGHVLEAEVLNEEGSIKRSRKIMFTEPKNKLTKELTAPENHSVSPALEVGGSKGPQLSLFPYQDSALGNAKIYEARLTGTIAIDSDKVSVSDLVTLDVVWNVFISSSRLKKEDDGIKSFIILPTLNHTPRWDSTWALSTKSNVDVKLSAYASNYDPNILLRFIEDSVFKDGLEIAQVVGKNKFIPAATP